MKVINLSEHHSVLQNFLREIRDVDIQKDRMRFRRNIERIGEVMAIELSKELNYQTTEVQTPLAKTTVETISDELVLATILRAGMPLHQGFLNIFDHAENAFLSAYRRVNAEGELEIVAEYMAAPAIVCCTIATPQSIDYMRQMLNDSDDITLWCAAIDPVLNEKKYIVPGLGDAGDLCYGTKIHLSDR